MKDLRAATPGTAGKAEDYKLFRRLFTAVFVTSPQQR
jgi:hypothetical protein